jgi:methionyl-tRNA formyltransferase
MDAGPIWRNIVSRCQPNARAGALTEELFHVGAHMLCDVITPYATGMLIPTPQDESRASYIGLLSRDDGRIDWHQPASHIERHVSVPMTRGQARILCSAISHFAFCKLV